MSITLKNITAADTISSMVDKINFNFDQLLLNGGGIEGPRGIEGYPGMQGAQGIKGNTGAQGDPGERGVHFHVLPLGNSTLDPSIEYARIHGLDQYDPYGDEYMEGDMIIAYRSESNIDGDYNYTDSIWRVEWDDTLRNFKPVYAIKDSNIEKHLLFSTTTFFEDFAVGSSTNRLLRTSFVNSASDDSSNAKRGIILNDYEHKIDISESQLDDIVNNNIVLVYAEKIGQSQTDGSPNCGIVFYKNGNTSSEIGDFPRINYVYSDANDNSVINHFNICAPKQGLQLQAKNNILIKSEIGDVVLDVTDENSSFELKRNSFNFITLRKQNSHNELHLAADEIFIENSENITSDQWIKIRNKDYSDTTTCEIILNKQKTYVQAENSSIFTIGKSGLEFKPSVSDNPTSNKQESVEAYYNQSRITLINDESNPHIDIITPKLYIGRDPYYTEQKTYGMYLSKEITSILTTKIDDNDNTKFYKSGIILNTETPYKSTIILDTTYPGVVNIANVSETYSDCIINYPHSSMADIITSERNSEYFCTSPMTDFVIRNGRYSYANMNCYYNMAVRHSKNMGAIHGGTITFTGKYSNSSTDTYDKLIYNFIRIGSTVQCKVSGTINLNKISAAYNYSGLDNKTIPETKEIYCKGNGDSRVTWPINFNTSKNFQSPIDSIAAQWAGANTSNSQELLNSDYSYKKESVLPAYKVSMASVSLNKLYLNLFPPVVRIECNPNTTDDNEKYIANVTDFIGHLTYTSAGNTYKKQLEYYNDLLIPTDFGTTHCYKIRAITIRDMKNSSSSDTNSSYYWDGINYGNSGFLLNGTTETNVVEINAEFSYKIRTEHYNKQDDLFQHQNEPINLGDRNVH